MGKKLFLFAAAAVALASCTETDLSGDTSFAKESTSDAIQFSAKAGNSGATRAGATGTITTTSLKTGTHNAGFGVMGYRMTADWTNEQNTTTPNFMFNEQVTWNTTNGYWTYDPVKYWPNGIDKANDTNGPSSTATSTNQDKLNFFAYAPWVEVAGSPADYTAATGIKLLKFGSDATGRNAFYTEGASNTDLGNGIAAIKANNVQAAPEVYYYMPTATTANAVDLLWGLRGSKTYKETDATDNTDTNLGNSYNVDLTKQDVPETVDFLFKHALSKIGGNTSSKTSTTGNQQCGLFVVLDVDGNGYGETGRDNQTNYLGSNFKPSQTLVTIKSVSVEDGKSAADATHVEASTKSNLKNSGWFNLATGSWSDVDIIAKTGTTSEDGATYNIDAALTGDYILNTDIAEPASTPALDETDKKKWKAGTGIPTGVVTTEAKPVYADTKTSGTEANDVPALLMIPNGATAQTLYVTVEYIVRTADPQLSTGFTEVTQTVTNKVDLTGLDVNKYYKLVMHLGLTSVKFSAIVTDWTTTDDATYDEGGVHEGTNPSEEEVWLPSNVINATIETTQATGTASNVNTAAKTTEYTIKLSGLAENEIIKAKAAAGSNITAVKIGANDITSEHTLTAAEVTSGVEIKVTLTPNTKVSAISNLLTIERKDASNNELSPTTINIVQSPYDIVLAETTAGKIVSTKDGDKQDVNVGTGGFTLTILDSEGVAVANSEYSIADGTITMTTPGTYTVIVKYTDGAANSVTKTITIKQ